MSDLNPSDVLSDVPQGPKREDTTKSVYDKRPGHISFASDRANFGGCRLIAFTGGATTPPFEGLGLEVEDSEKFETQVDEFIKRVGTSDASVSCYDLANLYFSTRANLLVLNVSKTGSDEVSFLITNQLDDDDLAEFNEIQRRVQLDMREWREKQAEQKAAQAEVLAENRRLVEVGKKAEQHGFFKKLRELEAELAELKKGK